MSVPRTMFITCSAVGNSFSLGFAGQDISHMKNMEILIDRYYIRSKPRGIPLGLVLLYYFIFLSHSTTLPHPYMYNIDMILFSHTATYTQLLSQGQGSSIQSQCSSAADCSGLMGPNLRMNSFTASLRSFLYLPNIAIARRQLG